MYFDPQITDYGHASFYHSLYGGLHIFYGWLATLQSVTGHVVDDLSC